MRRAAILALSLAATPLLAQDDDRDFLTAFLEDNLSGAGREVTITGFAGALSARATIEQMTIADDQGIWLTINGATLDWSRSAILSGEVRVTELSAQEIIVARLPATAETESDLPNPEATPFSLPVFGRAGFVLVRTVREPFQGVMFERYRVVCGQPTSQTR
jgi:translocation and assembly module TamB